MSLSHIKAFGVFPAETWLTVHRRRVVSELLFFDFNFDFSGVANSFRLEIFLIASLQMKKHLGKVCAAGVITVSRTSGGKFRGDGLSLHENDPTKS